VTPIGWVVAALLAIAVVWLGLATVGLVREVSALREEVAALGATATIHLDGGLPVGAREPGWAIETDTGVAGADTLSGLRHLVVFADAGCESCAGLLPELARAAAAGVVPTVVVVGRAGDTVPATWRGARVVAGTERDRSVSDAFGVEVSPHVFVIDEGGAIVAQGGAVTLADVERLVHGAQGIRIVPGAAGG
jgi:hypothetical protein